jgi:hypothetical protein
MSFKMNLRHQRGTQGEEEEGSEENKPREARCKTTAWSEQGGEEGHDCEEEAHKIENPSESPEVVEVSACSVFSVGAEYVLDSILDM